MFYFQNVIFSKENVIFSKVNVLFSKEKVYIFKIKCHIFKSKCHISKMSYFQKIKKKKFKINFPEKKVGFLFCFVSFSKLFILGLECHSVCCSSRWGWFFCPEIDWICCGRRRRICKFLRPWLVPVDALNRDVLVLAQVDFLEISWKFHQQFLMAGILHVQIEERGDLLGDVGHAVSDKLLALGWVCTVT